MYPSLEDWSKFLHMLVLLSLHDVVCWPLKSLWQQGNLFSDEKDGGPISRFMAMLC